MRKRAGEVITFYSFKGGVGRSFALANVAVVLAQWGYRVLCIDWDLEAPGLHHYFERWTSFPRSRGLLALIEGFAGGARSETAWRQHVLPVRVPGTARRLFLVPAGQHGRDYVERVQRINWTTLYRRKGFGVLLESMREQWKRRFDFILVDSRTGISDIAGICTVQLPDALVFLFTANRQSLDGACDIARRSIASRAQLPFERTRLLTLPVISRYEQRVEFKIASRWDRIFEKKLQPFYRGWLPARTDPADILAKTRLPSVPYWTFGEELPVVVDRKRNDDPDSVNFSLVNTAALIANGFADANQLVSSRDAYLARSRRTSAVRSDVVKARGPIVFVSHGRGARRLASQVAEGLTHRGYRIRTSADFATAGKRDLLLDVLKEASSVVILFDESYGPAQLEELETYVSLSIRETGMNRIIPVVRSAEGLKRLPQILLGLELIDARSGSVATLIDKIAQQLETGKRQTRRAARFV